MEHPDVLVLTARQTKRLQELRSYLGNLKYSEDPKQREIAVIVLANLLLIEKDQ